MAELEEEQFRALLYKAEIYERKADWENALKTLQRWNDFSKVSDNNHQLWYKKGLLHYRLGEYVEAENYLSRLQYLSKSEFWQQNSLALLVLSLCQQKKWDQAESWALKCSDLDSEGSLQITELFQKFRKIKWKSSEKAENLSFVPGLGQLYAGYPMRALFSFGLQAGAISLGAWHVWQGYYAIGAYSGMGLFYLFYTGGMRHATYLADLKNKEKLSKIEREIIGLVAGSEKEEVRDLK